MLEDCSIEKDKPIGYMTTIRKELSRLRAYQVKGVDFLIKHKNALLADEMGLGKTVQVISALKMLDFKNKLGRAIVICPASLCFNWHYEIRKWAPNLSVLRVNGTPEDRRACYRLPVKVLIASYEQIRSDINFLRNEIDGGIIILDEAQKIKNIHSTTSLACRQLTRDRAWALSGTPIENKLDDLIALFSFISPHLLYRGMDGREIQSKIAPMFLRRKKNEVLKQLPAILEQNIHLEMDSGQRESYERALRTGRHQVREGGQTVSNTRIFAIISKLKQICNFDNTTGQSCKYEAVQLLLEKAKSQGGKVLIFSQFVETLKQLKVQMGGGGVSLLHGGLNQTQRNNLVNSFERATGYNVMLISLKAGGVGLNLNSASLVIMFDKWWNPAVEQQAINRAHRFGKKMPLHVVHFLIKDSIEEKIQEILEEKRKLFVNYVEKNEFVTDPLKAFTKEELLHIITESK